MKYTLSLIALCFASQVWAHDALPLPAECSGIAAACEKAGYDPGMHKKDGKGLWVDCVHAIAKGGTVTGVSNTQAEAKACIQAHRVERKGAAPAPTTGK